MDLRLACWACLYPKAGVHRKNPIIDNYCPNCQQTVQLRHALAEDILRAGHDVVPIPDPPPPPPAARPRANSRRRNTGWIKDGSRRAVSAHRPLGKGVR